VVYNIKVSPPSISTSDEIFLLPNKLKKIGVPKEGSLWSSFFFLLKKEKNSLQKEIYHEKSNFNSV